MKRRKFLKTSAGFLAVAVSPGIWQCSNPDPNDTKIGFESYRPGETLGDITKITPDDGYYIHTFYDVCPWSPSQRYLAINKLPFQDRKPQRGDVMDICIIDLQERTIRTVYSTKAWGMQIGGNLNWADTDRYLYTNDIIDGQGVCVRIDLESEERKAFAGPMYDVAPDGSSVSGFPLDLIYHTQSGYGMPPQSDNPRTVSGAPLDEGLRKTNLRTNEQEIIVTLAQVAERVPQPEYYEEGNFYFFHTKYSPKNNRIMQVVRVLFPESIPEKSGWNPQLFTFNPDGSDIQLAVERELWATGGNHPNWHPDGEHLIMNLTPDGENRRFCQFRYDGSDFKILTEKFLGSGHPRIEPEVRYIIADTYVRGPWPDDNGEVPLRLIDLSAEEEREVARINTFGENRGSLRVDPHPAWSRDHKSFCFNAVSNGNRQVYIADLSDVI